MRIVQFDSERVGISMLRVWLAAAALLLLPSASWADFLTVGCPGGTPGQFPSITAALNALPVNSPGEPHTILVTGICQENLFIGNRQRIEIVAPPGQTATITAANRAASVVVIAGSRAIGLRRLIIQGGGLGVQVAEESQVRIEDMRIEGNTNEGVIVQMGSVLDLQSSTIQNNGGDGLALEANSTVTAGFAPQQPVRINNNGGSGVSLDASFFQVNFGNLKVENNAGAALGMEGGRLLVFGGGGENLFQNNGEGIDIFNAASAHFFGKNTIRNNGGVGLQVSGSSVTFNGRVLPDGTLNATVIEGHSDLGVNIVRLGEVAFAGPHRIQNNSTLTSEPEFRSGIRISRAALNLNGGVQVTNNLGPGIMADLNTSLFVGPNATVSNNAEEGIHVTHQTVNRVVGPVTIQGNGTASIACDGTSLVFGDLGGIDDIACDNVEITGSVAGAGARSSAEAVTETNDVAPRQARRAGVVR